MISGFIAPNQRANEFGKTEGKVSEKSAKSALDYAVASRTARRCFILRLLANPWPRNNSAERYNTSESMLTKEIPAQADLLGAVDVRRNYRSCLRECAGYGLLVSNGARVIERSPMISK